MESIAHLTSRDDLSLGVSTVALADSVPKPPRHFFSKLDTALVDKRSVGTLAFHFFVWYIEKFIGQDGLSQIRHFAVEDIVWTELQKNPKQGDCIAFLASLDTFTVFSRKFGETDTPGEELELLEPIELRVNHPNGHMESVRSVVLRILTEYTQSLPGHRIPEIRMRNAGRRAGDGPSVTELPAMESLRLGE